MRLPSTGRATPVGRQLPLIPSKPTTQCHVYQHASVPSDGRLMASGESDLQNYPRRANQSDSARACPSHGMGQSQGALAWLRPVQISLYEHKRAARRGKCVFSDTPWSYLSVVSRAGLSIKQTVSRARYLSTETWRAQSHLTRGFCGPDSLVTVNHTWRILGFTLVAMLHNVMSKCRTRSLSPWKRPFGLRRPLPKTMRQSNCFFTAYPGLYHLSVICSLQRLL